MASRLVGITMAAGSMSEVIALEVVADAVEMVTNKEGREKGGCRSSPTQNTAST